MSTPWEILGLDPATADAKAVRSAYVRLVKVHRPDREPERFQEVRRAYEQAQRMVEHHEATGTPLEDLDVVDFGGGWVLVEQGDADGFEDDEDDESAGVFCGEGEVPFPESDVAPFVLDVPLDGPAPTGLRAEFETAREAGDAAAMQQVLREAREAWRRDPLLHADFPPLAAEHAKLYRLAVGDERASADGVLAAQRGSNELVRAMIGVWVAAGTWDRVTRLADDLLESTEVEPGTVSDSGLPVVLADLARALALKDTPRAHRLAEAAHRVLPAYYRGAVLHDVDVALHVADELLALAPGELEALSRALLTEEAPPDRIAALAVHNALRAAGPDSLTYKLLQERFPNAARGLRRAERTAAGMRRRGAEKHKFPYALVILAVALVVPATRLFSSGCKARHGDPLATELRGEGGGSIDRMLRDVERIRRGEGRPELDRVKELVRRIEEREALTEAELPVVYAAHPWLEPIRRRVGVSIRDQGAYHWNVIQGRAEIDREDDRYATMLRVFSQDETLPRMVRSVCQALLVAGSSAAFPPR